MVLLVSGCTVQWPELKLIRNIRALNMRYSIRALVNTTAEIRLDQAKAVLESDGLTFTREADYMAAEAGSGTYHIAFEQ